MNKDKKEMMLNKGMSRRAFLKTGTLAMGGLTASMMTGCGGDDVIVHPPSGSGSGGADLPESWDDSADLVFIGYGAAAALASIHAREADPNSTILILEAQASGGGSTKMSGGGTNFGAGTKPQTDAGFTEDADDFFTSSMARAGEGANEAVIRAYCDNAKEAYDTIAATGITYSGFDAGYYMSPPDGKSLIYDNETRPEYSSDLGLPSTPHLHFPLPEGGSSRAMTLWSYLDEAVSMLPAVNVSYNTTAKKLYVNSDGRVVGVQAEIDGSTVNFKASKAVLMCNGGFIKNDEMVQQFIPHAMSCFRGGNPMDLGTGIKMGQAIGADVAMMHAAEDYGPAFRAASQMVKSIAVNPSGMRFAPEDTGGPQMGTWISRVYPLSYLIFDQAVMDEIPAATQAGLSTVQANTIADLAAALSIPAASLEATVDTYNTFAANGADEQFRKLPSNLQAIDTPPYYALTRYSQEVFTLSNGGLRINENAEVLDTNGDVIPGFYAAGATTANINAQYYMNGGGTGGAFVFGLIAGKKMVEEDRWD